MLAMVCLGASAAHIGPEASLRRALNDSPYRIKGKAAEFRRVEIESAPEVYVFHGPSGFVVTPSDDNAPALLGCGEGPVGSNPEFDYFMEYLGRRVRYAADHPESVVTYKRPDWEAIDQLCKTQWNQGSPYNDLCPTDNGGRCVTGCVATSTAQLMKYHNWPERAQGTGMYYLYYKTDYQEEHSVDLSKYTFDWNNMLDSYYVDSEDVGTKVQRNAVANLMAAVGAGVNMQYTSDQSGAYSENVGAALINHFRYSKNLIYAERMYYNLGDWEEMIYNSLKTCGPVIYSGSSSAGGHSFICDGYQGDGMFHINWGWGGVSDGYFLLDILDPVEQGIGGSDMHFNEGQGAVLYARPEKADEQVSVEYVMRGRGESVTGPFNKELNIQNGDEIMLGSCFNYTPHVFPDTWQFGVVCESMYDSDDTLKGLMPMEEELNRFYGFNEFGWQLYDVPVKGLYKVYTATSVGGAEIWPVQVPVESARFAVGEADGMGHLTLRRLNIPMPVVSEMKMPVEIDMNDVNYEITADLSNHGVTELSGIIRAELLKDGEVVATGEQKSVTIPEGETIELSYNSQRLNPVSGQLAAGKYRLALSVRNGDASQWLPVAQPCDVMLTQANPSGIDIPGNDGVEQWFDMQGRRISGNPSASGHYIRIKGGYTEKVIVK